MINRSAESAGPASAILTFLIADVRGYTAFTRRAGDEAAARLAAQFAEIAREGVEAFGGTVVELRGDEALASFGSARRGLRAAAALRRVFADEVRLHPELPLRVGFGLDAGEAVALESGYRGGALNLAARLCAAAGPDDILASEAVAHLAGTTDGLVLQRRDGLVLKGLAEPVAAYEVGGDAPTPAQRRPGDGGTSSPSEPPEALDTYVALAGRDREARALRWAWRTGRDSDHQVRAIVGPAGIGKTRLAADVAALAAADGAAVRYASAARDRGAVDHAMGSDDDGNGQPNGPELLVLDDLDALPDGRLPLAELVRRLAPGPGGGRSLAVLIASDEARADARPDVARELGRVVGEARTVRLAPLDEAAVAAILESYGIEAPDPDRVRTVTRASAGRPARIHVLAAEWAEEQATSRLGGAASRAAAGRRDLRRYEEEVATNLVDLQLARERMLALRATATPGRPEVRADRSPFMGLASFDVGDADDFFGRERLVAEMVGRLAGAPFLGIVGPSGSGKSSALRAGLLSALAGGALPGSESWIRVLIRPGSDPVRELDRAVFAALDEDARSALPSGLDALHGALRTLPTGRTVLVAVDQFEETFTLTGDPAERSAFIGALVEAAASGRAVVVVAVRADFYGRCAEDARLAELLAANHLLVGPMRPEEYRRAIEGPARRAGLRVEPALVDDLVADVLDQPGGLPLLSTALLELWQGREGRTLTRAAYLETGGVEGAVARLAESAFDRLDAAQQATARTMFLRLTAEDAEAVVRRRVPLSELDAEANADVGRSLAVLTDARLLTVGEGSVEVAHEALLREWPRLATWIEEDRASRRLRGQLADASREWRDGGRDPGELYRGARLAAALDWTAGHEGELNALEREFVAESRAASEQDAIRQARANRRLRLLLGGTAIGLVVALVAGGLAFVQRQAADRATAEANAQEVAAEQQRRLAEEQRTAAQQAAVVADAQRIGAEALVTKDLGLSLLLARQAVALDDSPTTRADLLADLVRSPAAMRVLRPLNARLVDVAASADGRQVVVHNDTGSFAVIDAATGATRWTKSEYTFDAGPATNGLVWAIFDPDPLQIRVYDGQSGDLLRTIAPPMEHQLNFGFTPDLSLVAEVVPDGSRVEIFDGASQRRVRTIHALPGTQIVNVHGFAGGRWITSEARGHSDDPGAAFGRPGSLSLWGPKGDRPIGSVPVAAAGVGYARSPDGARLALLDTPDVGAATVVEVGSGRRHDVRGPHGASIRGATFSPDGSLLVTTSDDRVGRVWDAGSGELLETLEGHDGPVQTAAVTNVGGELKAWTASLDGTLIEWDLGGDRGLSRTFTAGAGTGVEFPSWPRSSRVAVSPDGRSILVGDEHGAVLVDASTYTVVRRLTHDVTRFPTGVAWSADGSRVAITGYGEQAVELLDTATWSPVRDGLSGPSVDRVAYPDEAPFSGGPGETDERRPNGAQAVVFSADSARLIAGFDDGTIWTWDARTGEPIGTSLKLGGPIIGLDVNQKNGWLAAAFDAIPNGPRGGPNVGSAAVFAPGETTPRYIVDADDNIGAVGAAVFSPDGTLLATGGGSGDLRFWDATTGKANGRHIPVTAGFVASVAWTADGRELVSGGTDGSVRLVDAATQSIAGVLPAIWTARANVAYVAARRSVVGVYEDGRAFEWSLDPAEWARFACAVAGRGLTEAEWSQYLPNEPYAPACGGG